MRIILRDALPVAEERPEPTLLIHCTLSIQKSGMAFTEYIPRFHNK